MRSLAAWLCLRPDLLVPRYPLAVPPSVGDGARTAGYVTRVGSAWPPSSPNGGSKWLAISPTTWGTGSGRGLGWRERDPKAGSAREQDPARLASSSCRKAACRAGVRLRRFFMPLSYSFSKLVCSNRMITTAQVSAASTSMTRSSLAGCANYGARARLLNLAHDEPCSSSQTRLMPPTCWLQVAIWQSFDQRELAGKGGSPMAPGFWPKIAGQHAGYA